MSDRKCLNCKKNIFGRSDKKFCDDECRNEFNNSKNKDVTNYMRRVNNLIRKNRNILCELNPNGKSKTTKKKLDKAGFDFNHFTSIYQTKTGNTYYFCYDHGYLALENDWYALVIKQEYTE